MKILKNRDCSAFVLYAVLIVVLLSSMVAVSLLYATKSAETASSAGEEGEQAWAVALSGVYKAIQVAQAAQAGLAEWQNNPNEFKEQLVAEDGQDKWYFTVYDWSGSEDSEGAIIYGLTDEARKLNLKYLPETLKERSEESELLAALKNKLPLEGVDSFALSFPEVEADESGSVFENQRENPREQDSSKPELVPLTGSSSPPEFEFLDAFIAQQGYNLKTLYGKD